MDFHWRWFQSAPGFVPWARPVELLQFLAKLHHQRWVWGQEPPWLHNPAPTSASSTACCPSPLEPSLDVQKKKIIVYVHKTSHMFKTFLGEKTAQRGCCFSILKVSRTYTSTQRAWAHGTNERLTSLCLFLHLHSRLSIFKWLHNRASL